MASNMSYGTLPAKGAPVENDIERMQAMRVHNSITELVSEIKFGRSLMMMALFVTVLLCASTFTMVVLATNYSKETVVVNGVLTEKATDAVVSTAEHTEVIPQPLSLNGAQGVKRVVIAGDDGSLISHRVESASRYSCKGSAHSQRSMCNTDGFFYLFETNRGTFLGQNQNGLRFNLIDDSTATGIKAGQQATMTSKATGKGGF